MESLIVELGDRSYPIHIGADLLQQGTLLDPHLKSDQVCIVTNETVAPLYLAKVEAALGTRKIASVILPDGEQYKTLDTVAVIYDKLLDLNFSRSATLIALGGGVIGDMTGFAAATYQRGVRFIQIPTTLLSQVDSSVGGKTAIDTRYGKNLVGAFHQPRLVLADIDALDTLPLREIHAGYAEIAKYGLINDPSFWNWLENGAGQKLIEGDKTIRAKAVYDSCANKARVVVGDERETEGARALLNLGQTFGHALEAETDFGGLLLHGEAVAIGCVMAFALSAELGLCPQTDSDRVRRHFANVGLRTDPSQIPLNHWDSETLIHHMGSDKKVEDGSITFILARGIGQDFIARNIATSEVRAVLDRAIAA